MMNLRVPLSVTVSAGADQIAVLRFVFCCRLYPVEGEGQKTIAVLVEVSRIVSNGAPGVWTTENKLQKPPTTEKFPPVSGWALASGWPMVPLTAYTPPVLVSPPPS